MDQESIVLEIDPRSVHTAIVQANKDVESWEKGTVGAGERMQKSLERMADMLIKINDNSRSSMERLTQSIEKQAAAYGKTGVDKLIAERDRLIKKLGDEQGMVDRVRAAYEKMIAVEEKKNGGGAEAFGKQIEAMIRDPLNGAKEAATGLLEKLGTMGTGLAVGVGVLTAIAAAGWEAAKSLGEYGTRIRDVEMRTGLAAKEVGQFEFAAKAVGQDVSIVERLMRGLSQAADDNSREGEKARATMQRLGLDLRNASGEMKPTSLILSEVSDAMNKLPEGVQRDAAAMDLFKRVGVEAIPFLTELNENLREAKAQGFGPTEDDVRRFTEYQHEVAELQTKWDALMRKFKEGLVTTLTISINWIGAGVKWFLDNVSTYGDDMRQRQEEEDARQIAAAGGLGAHGSRSQHRALQRQMDQMAPAFMQDKPAIEARIAELKQQQQDLVGNLGWMAMIAPTEVELARMKKAADIQKDIEQMQYTLQEAEKATHRADLKEGQSYIEGLRSRYFGSHDGIEEAYSQARKDVENYRKQLFEPEHPLTKTEASDLNKKLVEAEGREARAKASLDVESERKKFLTESQSFVRKGDEAELDAIGKIYYQRDLLLQQAAKVKASEAEIAAIRKSADEQAGKVLKESMEKFEEYDQKRRADQQKKFLELFLPTKEQMKEWEDVFKAQERIEDIGVQAQKEALRRHANAGVKQAETPEDAYRIRVDLAVQLAQIEVDRIVCESDHAKQMVMAAEAQKQLYADLAAAQDELEEKRAEAARKHAEELQRQLDSIQKTSSGLIHTLFTKPQDFPKQLGSTVHEAILKPVTEGLGGMVAGVLHPLIYGSDGQGGISGALKGIFGGGKQDPMKTATDQNTVATAQNSAHVWALTATLAAFMGMSAPAVASPSIPGLAGASMPAITMSMPGIGGGASIASLPALALSLGTAAYSPAPWAGGGLAAGATGGYTPAPWAGGGGYSPLGGYSPAGGASPLGHGGLAGLAAPGGKGGFSLSNLKGSLGNLENFVVNPKIWDATGTSFGAYAGSVLTSPAAMMAGMMMGTSGLMGSHRGTWGGVAMGTAGGALVGAGIGAQFGGPMGAALGAGIGAVAGFGIGVGEKLFGVETPENQAKRLTKQLYLISIDDSMAKQIVNIAQQKYAGEVSVAVRDPDVRKMLMLYSQATGQKMPLSATTPQSAALAESGGRLYQQASYVNGTPYSFQSNLPVLGGYPTGSYPTPGGPMSLQLNVSGQGAAQFVAGQVVTPEFVQAQWSSAGASSNGRLQNSAMIQQPGLVIS